MPVYKILQDMPATELLNWKAMYQIDPFGTFRDNLHTGMIASTVYNMQRGKNSRPMKATDFLIKDKNQRRAEETAQTLAALNRMAIKNGNQ